MVCVRNHNMYRQVQKDDLSNQAVVMTGPGLVIKLKHVRTG